MVCCPLRGTWFGSQSTHSALWQAAGEMFPRGPSSQPRRPPGRSVPPPASSSPQPAGTQQSLPHASPASAFFQGAAHGMPAPAAFPPKPGGKPSLLPQAPPPPRFGALPRYGVNRPGAPPPPGPRVGLSPPRPGQPPSSGVQATEAMEDHQAPGQAMDPISREASSADLSTAWSVGDEEFLHRSNFVKLVTDSFSGSMDGGEYYINLISKDANHFGWSEMGSQPDDQEPSVVDGRPVRWCQEASRPIAITTGRVGKHISIGSFYMGPTFLF